MLDRSNCEKLARINWRRTIEIVEPAHFPGEIRARQNPAAAQPADAIDLRQTARHNELRAEQERSARRSLINRIQIDLVHQHERSNTARYVADLPQNPVRRKRTRWIVQVSNYDQS